MKLEGENVLLRVFLHTFQKWRHRPVYETIVMQARKEGLSGATVLAGVEGFGQNTGLLKEHTWQIANDREVIVEIVDTQDRIEAFLASIEPMLQDTIVTLERAHVIHYRNKEMPGK